MTSPESQRLRIVPSEFTIGHAPEAIFPEDDEWIALIRAPEGLTVIREAWGQDAGRRWIGFYSDRPSGYGVPGMLSGVVNPLSTAEVPVFVASTFHADLVLVPAELRDDAVIALKEAGHIIVNA
ncbi:MAG: hypothetical protein JWO67_2329 [Streptosporangiaceae bacterium]|nr:hypothetical protein [Streptosporangiaceae bacterium]